MSYYHDDDGSNEEAIREARNIFIWTVIGVAVVLAIVLLLSFVFDPTRAELAQARKSTIIGGCDETLWAHTYHSERLQVIERCASVTGVIVDATHGKRKDGVRKEADGDCHGWLKLDAGQERYINAGNISDEESNLVFEIVCLYKVTQKDAISACVNYKNKIKLPAIGSHVRMTGSFVQDDNHAKWNEIHPVSSIEVLR